MSAPLAIGTSAATSPAPGGGAPSTASMRAQLQRFQKILNECVNCASARTAQGKADIQATELRISQLEERIVGQQKAEAGSTGGTTANPTQARTAANMYGGVIDVFA